MSVNLSPIGNDAPFLDSSGNPLSGGLLHTYTAGSSTAENTYTTSAGSVANANPIVLNSGGYPASGGSVVEIWLTAGVTYKFELQTSAGVSIWTRDNIDGINDTTVTADEWLSGPTPTYVAATQFTLVGDQTTVFHVGRRLKTTNTAGTIYSRISVSAYTSLTTITVVNDSGVLDSGLSAVYYGLISAANTSDPAVLATLADAIGDTLVASAVDKFAKLAATATVAAHATTCDVWTARETVLSGAAVTFTALAAAPYAGAVAWVWQQDANIWTDGATFDVQGGATRTVASGDLVIVRAITTSTFDVVVCPALPAATQAEQETGTDIQKYVVPGRQQFHSSAAKCWIDCDAAGNIGASYNITSITDTGTGIVTVTIGTDFSGTSYAVVSSGDTGGGGIFVGADITNAGVFRILGVNSATQLAQDAGRYFAVCYGDQA